MTEENNQRPTEWVKKGYVPEAGVLPPLPPPPPTEAETKVPDSNKKE